MCLLGKWPCQRPHSHCGESRRRLWCFLRRSSFCRLHGLGLQLELPECLCPRLLARNRFAQPSGFEDVPCDIIARVSRSFADSCAASPDIQSSNSAATECTDQKESSCRFRSAASQCQAAAQAPSQPTALIGKLARIVGMRSTCEVDAQIHKASSKALLY